MHGGAVAESEHAGCFSSQMAGGGGAAGANAFAGSLQSCVCLGGTAIELSPDVDLRCAQAWLLIIAKGELNVAGPFADGAAAALGVAHDVAGAWEVQGPLEHAERFWLRCCGAESPHGSQSAVLRSSAMSRSVGAAQAGTVAICTKADTVGEEVLAVGEARSYVGAGLVAVAGDVLGDAEPSLFCGADWYFACAAASLSLSRVWRCSAVML